MKRIFSKPIIQSMSGGLIMSLAWWEHFSGLIMLIAFIPFLNIIYKSKTERKAPSKVFTQTLPGFLIFNLFSFSWLGNVSIAGATMAILAHSFMMSFALWLVYRIYNKSSLFTAAFSFVSIWMAYEYACLNIYIISPWLNTGNVFGKEPSLIQWYEYTGVAGGTLWILSANLAIYFMIIKAYMLNKVLFRHISSAVLIVILPIILSLFIGRNYTEDTSPVELVIVQPNIDPFSEKFENQSFSYQLEEMLTMSEELIDETTKWLILPETAIDDPFYESDADSSSYIIRLRTFAEAYDSLNIVLGATTKIYSTKDVDNNIPNIAEEIGPRGDRLFNSAIHISQKPELSFYHKSKLVPGFERKVSLLPHFLEKVIVPDIGGSMSGYGIQKERMVFTHSESGRDLAPVICYESAFGQYVTEYVNKGADIIAVITNDGWWKNTPGYKQHLWFSSLRAIETRRPVVRSANTGISCIIDKRGRITESLPWWEKGVIISDVYPGNKTTGYSTHGDLIYRYFTFAGLVILILAFIAAPIRNFKKMQPLK